ncbi:MAG: hypothetical protein RLZZ22_378 [Pseudomonadota bacterium]|jgi:signal transduction histidine kinase
MNKILKTISIGLIGLAFSAIANAGEKATPEEAMAMMKKAVAFVKTHGKDKAFSEFNNPKGQFVDRDLYVMCYDMWGNNKCHGSNPKLVGKNLLEIKDSDGKFIVKGLIAVASKDSGKGWFEYKWPNAVTKTVEAKST